LSIEELLAVLNASREREGRERKFQAALQGVDIEEDSSEQEDVTKVKGYRAQQEGFGIGLGLGHVVEGG
jgi:hypothetical protein